MAIVSTRLAPNPAFLYEIKEDNQELWRLLDDLRQTFRQMPHALAKPLVAKLTALRDQLAMHFALEEFYGYMEDPIAVAPQLSDLADELRSEHATLFVQACALVEQAEDMDVQGPHLKALRDLGEDFDEFDRDLRRHESAEGDLILKSLDEDIGVGD